MDEDLYLLLVEGQGAYFCDSNFNKLHGSAASRALSLRLSKKFRFIRISVIENG